MKRLVSTRNLSKEDWLRYRKCGITGTDAGAILEQSEKEVADLHQRTREGLLTARLNGKQVGRKKGIGFETKKSKAAKEKIRIHCKAFGGTLDDMECMKLTGLARNTYYKYKRQIRADLTDEGKLKKEELLCKTKNV